MGLLDAVRAELDVLNDLSEELCRQDEKWGVQNHPGGTGPTTMPLNVLAMISPAALSGARAPHLATTAKRINDMHVSSGRLTWTDILLEELFEALAEPEGSEALRTELVQVAAVAIQWVLAIDRRNP